MELVNFPVHVFAAGCFLYSGDEEQRQAWFPAKRNERIARIANKMLAYNLTQAVCVRCVKILRNETYANTLRGLRGVDCAKRCIVLHTRKFI